MDSSHPAFELLRNGDTEALRKVLTQDPALADARDSSGVSLLMHAIYRGQRDLAEGIAGKKKELDIFEAASLGRMARLQECLRDAAAIHALSKDGFTALHFACYFGQPEAARLLLQKGARVDAVATNATQVMPLHSAASARSLEAARLLLEHGAPVNARQQHGWAPIHAAAQNGDRGMVELLLQHGADLKIASDQGKTPAMIAGDRGHTELASLLEGPAAKS